MFEEITLTSYAPAMRYTNGQLSQQSDLVTQNKLLVSLINSISQMVVILNEHRQIVYANKSYMDFCKVSDSSSLIGKRPGETIDCVNAFRTEAGCGTSEFCKTCGAVNAILKAQSGQKSTKECKILTTNNKAHELRVTATPFDLNGLKLTIFSMLDISAEKRKESLERVFLHDIMNSAGGISGLSAILKEIDDPKEMAEIAETIEGAANNLIDEIKTQRELCSAEKDELEPDFVPSSSFSILNDLKATYSKHQLNPGKKISIHSASENTVLNTDPILLKRVIGNMIKNAIEANQPNDSISLCATRKNHSVCFSVNNRSYIPPEVQKQLFQRTYSTKGAGRGIGTYSMKLLGEKYLKGEVWFESTLEKGTTFYIELCK